MAVPIIHLIGMGQGILVWSSVTLLTGWATGRYVESLAIRKCAKSEWRFLSLFINCNRSISNNLFCRQSLSKIWFPWNNTSNSH